MNQRLIEEKILGYFVMYGAKDLDSEVVAKALREVADNYHVAELRIDEIIELYRKMG